MAKVNRSQLVRDLLESTPQMEPKDIVKELLKDGHKITPHLVYKVKGAMAERKHRKQRIAKAAMGENVIGNGFAGKTDAVTLIREVKALAAKAGGYARLMELVAAMGE